MGVVSGRGLRPRPLVENGAAHPHTKFQLNPSKYVAVGAEKRRFLLVGVAYGHAHPALRAENHPGGPRAPPTEFGPNPSSRFRVYTGQTHTQTDRHTHRQISGFIYIDVIIL